MRQAPRPESRLGRFLHRAFFLVLSFLPRRPRIQIQRLSFDTLFKASSDPWSYQDSAYEAYKRQQLMESIPLHVNSLLEVGCADGHNLSQIETRFDIATLVGIDISSQAIQQAQGRGLERSVFLEAKPGITQQIHSQYGTFDVLIFSEVLYYLGSRSAWKELLTPLKVLLHPGSIVIAVHPASDSKLLHDRLCEILGLETISDRRYEDESRPFEIRIATLPKG